MEGPLTLLPAFDEVLRRALLQTAAIAFVGASPRATRPSHQIMAAVQNAGYRALPVNPREAGGEILGERVVPSLADVDTTLQIVDIFRKSALAGEAIDQAIAHKDRLGIRVVWLQLGIRDEAAEERAHAAGLIVVTNRCLAVEIRRLRC